MAEVKCFQHSKNCTKKNINYLRIQRFKRLIHWFRFDPVRDLSHLVIVKTFLLHSAAEFLCERKSSIFWRRQKSCSIHHRQIRLRTPKERAVFSDCLERIWSPQSLSHQPNKILCHPSHPTDFFATQILGGHVTSRNQGLSSNDQERQRRETLGTRLRFSVCTFSLRWWIELWNSSQNSVGITLASCCKSEHGINSLHALKLEFK